jgi:hypothetical protein
MDSGVYIRIKDEKSGRYTTSDFVNAPLDAREEWLDTLDRKELHSLINILANIIKSISLVSEEETNE